MTEATLHALRHRLTLLANSAERLLKANDGQVRQTFAIESGVVADDILAARAILDGLVEA